MIGVAGAGEESDLSLSTMRQDRSKNPIRTRRRTVETAAASPPALRPSRMPPSGDEPYLERLLRRRRELERALLAFSAEADALSAAGPSSALRRRLHRVQRAEVQASQSLERLEWVIADTPAETLEDVEWKLRFWAELQGDEGPGTGWRAPFTVEEHLLRTIVADLKRLKDK